MYQTRTVVGARVLGFQFCVIGYRSHAVTPETQNSRLGTEDPCTEDCPGLLTQSVLELRGIRSVVKLNHYPGVSVNSFQDASGEY